MPVDFEQIYLRFNSPVAVFDCGEHCAPYNEHGVPFCCDLRHTIPTVYPDEWDYLKKKTQFWRLWEGTSGKETEALRRQAPNGHVLVACSGHNLCQRNFRALTCRAFPFFPYLTKDGEFIGLAYYWEYADRCWVVNHLEVITRTFLEEFIEAFEVIFRQIPEERENFLYYSSLMRRIFGRRKRAIPLVHRNGLCYLVTPHNGRMRRIPAQKIPKQGAYKIAAKLPFPDEEDPVVGS